jgi:hypothetical protein
LKGAVVREQSELFASLKIMAQSTQSMDDSQELKLMHRVVHLGRGEFPALIAHRATILLKNSTNTHTGGIGVELKSGRRTSVWYAENRGREHGSLQLKESILSIRGKGGREGTGGRCEGGEWGSNGGKVLDKTVVKVAESKEAPDLSDSGGQRPVSHGSKLLRISRHTSGGDDVAKKFGFPCSKRTLGQFEVEVSLFKGFKNCADVVKVFLLRGGPDHQVIKINGHKAVQVGAQNIIHDLLASGGGIGQTKRHDSEFEMSVTCAKSSLVNVRGGHGNLMVGRGQVQGSEVACITEVINEVINAREGVRIFDSQIIESTVVHTEPQGAIRFAGKNYRSTKSRGGWADPTFLQVHGELLLELFKFCRGHAAQAMDRGFGVRFEVNSVGHTSL